MSKPIRAKQMYTTPEAVSNAFYEACEARDIEAMMAVWADDEEIVCVHPGGPRLVGYDAVRASWEQLFSGAARVQFQLEGPLVVETVGLAMQTVYEYVTVGDEPRPRGGTIATNVYLRTPTGWRMVMHHASAAPRQKSEPESVARQLH